MTIVSIPAGTPITVEALDEYSLRCTTISKEINKIVEETGIAAIRILTELIGTEGYKQSPYMFEHVKTDTEYVNNLIETGVQFWRLEKDVKLEFDDDQAA
ncbi:MAG: hypothetical protein PHG82_02940 [Candidatus Gracilibacteria bacterium]|nr:hypothetical protein [Candidatus Gracilibacteria bacterium]